MLKTTHENPSNSEKEAEENVPAEGQKDSRDFSNNGEMKTKENNLEESKNDHRDISNNEETKTRENSLEDSQSEPRDVSNNGEMKTKENNLEESQNDPRDVSNNEETKTRENSLEDSQSVPRDVSNNGERKTKENNIEESPNDPRDVSNNEETKTRENSLEDSQSEPRDFSKNGEIKTKENNLEERHKVSQDISNEGERNPEGNSQGASRIDNISVLNEQKSSCKENVSDEGRRGPIHKTSSSDQSGKSSGGSFCYFIDSSDTLIRPRGLANLGNTCYFNSVLQPLCHTHALYKALGNNLTDNGLTKSFFELLFSMQIDQRRPFDPKELRDKFVSKVPRFNNHRQHDSHECLRHILDEIRKEERAEYNPNPGHSLTTVDKIFGGHLVTVYICKECNKHYHLFEPCLDLSLPVFFEAENETNENKTHRCHSAQDMRREDDKTTDNTRTDNYKIQRVQETVENAEQRDKKKDISYQQSIKKLTKRLSVPSDTNFSPLSFLRKNAGKYFSSLLRVTLDNCLQHFFREEEIHEEYLCEDCMRDATAKGEADEENLKLTCATKQTLIFNPPAVFTIHFKRFELLPGRCRKRSDMVKYPEYLDVAPYCSSQCLRNDPPRSSIWYSLYAVVVHSGFLENGHYLAYVKVRAKQENINKLENYLQKDYFNHNVTPDELIDMMMDIKVRTDAKYLKGHASHWYLISDNVVHEVKLGEVLGQEAYLLFYERVDAIETMSTSESTDSVDCRTSFNVNKIENETETVPNALLEHGQAETNFSASQKVTRQTQAESNFASDETVKGQTENESYTALEKVQTETKLNVLSGKVQTVIKNIFSSGQPFNDQTETGRNDSSENDQTKVRREISIAEQNWKNPHHHGLPHHFEETSRPRGLRNLGNTYYFNSVLQSLCHTHILSNELGKVSIENGLGWSLFESSLHMQIDKASPFDPKELRVKFVSKVPSFNNHRQHDSHECLRHILDEIRKEERAEYNPNPGRSLTTVDKIFGGHLVTVYICKECNNHYHLFEPCLDLSLPVFLEPEKETNENKTHRCHSAQDMRREDDKTTDNTRTDNCKIQRVQDTVENAEQKGKKKDISYQQSIKKLTKRLSVPSDTNFSPLSFLRKNAGKYFSSLLHVTLDKCLQHFSREEEIHEEYLCEDCMRDAMAKGEADEENLKLTCATKQTLIFNPPAVLTIHFKRFELLPRSSKKRSDMVEYPEYLNVAPYCSSQCLRNDPPRSSIWYSLYAVVVHSGSLEFSSCKVYVKVRERQENIKRLENYLQKEYFNHNITSDEMMGMIKDITVRTDSKFLKSGATNWYLINDGAVSKVNLDEVLGQEAYLLFYERVDAIETASGAENTCGGDQTTSSSISTSDNYEPARAEVYNRKSDFPTFDDNWF